MYNKNADNLIKPVRQNLILLFIFLVVFLVVFHLQKYFKSFV